MMYFPEYIKNIRLNVILYYATRFINAFLATSFIRHERNGIRIFLMPFFFNIHILTYI